MILILQTTISIISFVVSGFIGAIVGDWYFILISGVLGVIFINPQLRYALRSYSKKLSRCGNCRRRRVEFT